jgi:formylglycine-generating enzyme required for sulfatase activity
MIIRPSRTTWKPVTPVREPRSGEHRGALAVDPPGPAGVDTDLATARACRGGAYGSVRRHLRAACRGWSHAIVGARRLGFRVAALPARR